MPTTKTVTTLSLQAVPYNDRDLCSSESPKSIPLFVEAYSEYRMRLVFINVMFSWFDLESVVILLKYWLIYVSRSGNGKRIIMVSRFNSRIDLAESTL